MQHHNPRKIMQRHQGLVSNKIENWHTPGYVMRNTKYRILQNILYGKKKERGIRVQGRKEGT